MSLRTTLVLMVLFIVLGSFAIFDPLRRQEKNEEKKDREEHVVWLKNKQLESLRITGKHGTTELVCALKEGCPFDGGGEWEMKQPLQGKADSSSAATLASTILNLRQNEKLEIGSAPDSKEFGFDQPQAELTLKAVGEAAITFKFGKAAAVGPNVYLSLSTAPANIYLVPSYVPDMLNKESFHWQNKRVFPNVEGNSFTRFGWTTGRTEIRAFKLKEQWRLQSPMAAAASTMMLEGLASTLAYAVAKSVFSSWRGSNEAKALLKGKPEMEFLFSTKDGGAHQLKLYPKPAANARGPKEFVAVVDQEPMMVNVDAATFDRFKKPVLEYRQRSLLSEADRALVNEVRFTFPRDNHESIFKLEGAEWKYVSGAKPAEAISQRRVEAFLDSLRDASISAFYPSKGNVRQAKAYRTQPTDLYLELKHGAEIKLAAKFVVQNRGLPLTELEGELAEMSESFLQLLPARLTDLYESSNKQVIVQEEPNTEKGADHGDPHHPGDEHNH